MLYIILLLVGVASQASQVQYNPRTGAYEQVADPIPQNAPRQRLFSGVAKKRDSKPWLLPSLSIYGGMSLHAGTSDELTYDDNTQNTEKQTIPSAEIINGNAVFGAEFMFPISTNMKLGGGASHNTKQSIFNGVIATNAGALFNLHLNNALYGKLAYKFGRVSIYTLLGMQTSTMSFYDSISKDNTTDPWTYKKSQSQPTYNLLGTFAAKNSFFGIGASYKLSPAFSVFIDSTYLTLSGLNGTAESTATAGQIQVLQNAQYSVIQQRFGFSFDFIGLASNTL